MTGKQHNAQKPTMPYSWRPIVRVYVSSLHPLHASIYMDALLTRCMLSRSCSCVLATLQILTSSITPYNVTTQLEANSCADYLAKSKSFCHRGYLEKIYWHALLQHCTLFQMWLALSMNLITLHEIFSKYQQNKCFWIVILCTLHNRTFLLFF